jgi:DNA-binding FrmR family transcriptional regulator
MIEDNNLSKRLSKVQGQVEGIQKMVSENRNCLDVIQQIAAVRSALAKVGVELLKKETSTCIKENENFEKLLDSLFKLS